MKASITHSPLHLVNEQNQQMKIQNSAPLQSLLLSHRNSIQEPPIQATRKKKEKKKFEITKERKRKIFETTVNNRIDLAGFYFQIPPNEIVILDSDTEHNSYFSIRIEFRIKITKSILRFHSTDTHSCNFKNRERLFVIVFVRFTNKFLGFRRARVSC